MTQNESPAGLGRGRPAEPEPQSRTTRPLVLELIIAETEPPAGTVRAAGSEAPVAFHGWIDLMAAISSMGERPAAEPGLPSGDSGR